MDQVSNLGINCRTYIGFNGSLSPDWHAISYKIYFNSNGGTVSESSRTVAYGSKLGNLPVPSRAGYQFAGWFTNAGNQVSSSTIMGASNLDLYAHWTQTDYSGPTLSVSSSVAGVLYQGSAYGVFNYTFADSGSGIYGYYWGTTYPTATNVSYTKYSGSSLSLTNAGGTYYFAVMDNCGNISISTSKCQKGAYGGSGGSQTIYTSGYRYFTASGNNHGGFGIADNNGTAIAYGKANVGCSFDCSSYLYLRAGSDQGMYYIMIN